MTTTAPGLKPSRSTGRIIQKSVPFSAAVAGAQLREDMSSGGFLGVLAGLLQAVITGWSLAGIFMWIGTIARTA